MSRSIFTADLKQTQLRGEEEYWVYNGLDCCVTCEVFDSISIPDYAKSAYDYSRALQAPVLEMMLRGWLIDAEAKQNLFDACMIKMSKLRKIIERYTQAMGDQSVLGPKSISSRALTQFLYSKLKLPPQYEIDHKTRERKLSSNREALEKLSNYQYAQPLCKALMAFRDLDKEKDTLSLRLDHDGRIRTSYNIGGTETWRFSSSENAFGGGTNLQNIEPSLRRIFVADYGYKLCNIDLEQAESRLVGWLAYIISGKTAYIDTCESGDLHTQVARMVWPELPWTDDLSKNKKVSAQPIYRGFTYRDLAKRGGHATNYLTTPPTMSKHLKIPLVVAQKFQAEYFKAFPEIREWHTWIATQLQTMGYIDNLFNFRRYFLGRRFDDSTLRAAIAHVPQSTISIVAKIGLFRIWNQLDVQVLHENHDNVIFQFKESDTHLIEQAIDLMKVTFTHNGRSMTVPPAAKTGWIWAEEGDCDHPDALIPWNRDKIGDRVRSFTPQHNRRVS